MRPYAQIQPIADQSYEKGDRSTAYFSLFLADIKLTLQYVTHVTPGLHGLHVTHVTPWLHGLHGLHRTYVTKAM